MRVAFYHGGRTLTDRLICWITGSKYSHCELVLDDERWLSASHAAGGVSLQPYEPGLGWEFIDLPEHLVGEAAAYYADAVDGMKYDYLGTVRFIIPWVRQDYDRWFCSELVACALLVSGLTLKLPPSTYSPGSLRAELALL